MHFPPADYMLFLANQKFYRLLRDAQLLESKLGKIDGGEELGAYMVGIVKAKRLQLE